MKAIDELEIDNKSAAELSDYFINGTAFIERGDIFHCLLMMVALQEITNRLCACAGLTAGEKGEES